MKNNHLLIVALLLISNLAFAQWEKTEYVDDFGDPTGNYYESMTAYGTFSNSATQGSDLTGSFIHDPKAKTLSIKVYEYGKSLATSIQDTYQTVKIKTPNGEILKIRYVLFSTNGVLYFNKGKYKKIKPLLEQNGEYTMIFEKGNGSSSYKLKYTIE